MLADIQHVVGEFKSTLLVHTLLVTYGEAFAITGETLERLIMARNDIADLLQIFARYTPALGTARASGESSPPLLVAIDTAREYPRGMIEFGVSILDMRCLSCNKLSTHTNPLLWTHTYKLRATPSAVKSTREIARFDGGVSRVPAEALKRLLAKVFARSPSDQAEECCGAQVILPFDESESTNGTCSLRSQNSQYVIIVGHSLGSDLAVLNRAGFYPNGVANIVRSFDTQRLARELYWSGEGKKNLSLKEACERIAGIKVKGWHSSGNDAAYAMIALLAIPTQIGRSNKGSESYSIGQHLIGRLDSIVHIILLTNLNEKEKRQAVKRRFRFLEKSKDDWETNLDGGLFD